MAILLNKTRFLGLLIIIASVMVTVIFLCTNAILQDVRFLIRHFSERFGWYSRSVRVLIRLFNTYEIFTVTLGFDHVLRTRDYRQCCGFCLVRNKKSFFFNQSRVAKAFLDR